MTSPTIESGTASRAPNGPHIQVQKAKARNTRSGLSVSRRPMMVGVTKCPSVVVTAMSPSGAMNAWLSDEPGADADDDADRGVDDRHHREIAGEVALDIVHDS